MFMRRHLQSWHFFTAIQNRYNLFAEFIPIVQRILQVLSLYGILSIKQIVFFFLFFFFLGSGGCGGCDDGVGDSRKKTHTHTEHLVHLIYGCACVVNVHSKSDLFSFVTGITHTHVLRFSFSLSFIYLSHHPLLPIQRKASTSSSPRFNWPDVYFIQQRSLNWLVNIQPKKYALSLFAYLSTCNSQCLKHYSIETCVCTFEEKRKFTITTKSRRYNMPRMRVMYQLMYGLSLSMCRLSHCR